MVIPILVKIVKAFVAILKSSSLAGRIIPAPSTFPRDQILFQLPATSLPLCSGSLPYHIHTQKHTNMYFAKVKFSLTYQQQQLLCIHWRAASFIYPIFIGLLSNFGKNTFMFQIYCCLCILLSRTSVAGKSNVEKLFSLHSHF